MRYSMTDESLVQIIIENVIDHIESLNNLRDFISLCNNIFPFIGVKGYFESIDNGFVIFTQDIPSLQRIHKYPVDKQEFSKIIEQITQEKEEKVPIAWHLRFIQNPTELTDDELFEILQSYWEHYGAVTNIQYSSDGAKIYEIWFEDIEVCVAALNFIMNGVKSRFKEYGILTD
jgi:hydroxymethylpyrimidine pyrophosphatase-like HAD family hydrolase